MKALAVFVLSSGLAFLPATGVATLSAQCVKPSDTFTLSISRKLEDVVSMQQKIIECLNSELEDTRLEIYSLKADEKTADDIGSPLYKMETRLMNMETTLSEMKTDLSAMEHRLTTDEHIIDLLISGPSTQHRLASKPTASNPKAPANKPKPTVKQTTPANPQ